MTTRSESQIQDELARADDVVQEGRTNVPGFSYEEGVQAALLWVMNRTDCKPMDG